jgi:outer membrane lipoprotein-sorting protein
MTNHNNDNHNIDRHIQETLAGHAPNEVLERCAPHFEKLQSKLAQPESSSLGWTILRRFSWASAGAAFCVLTFFLASLLVGQSNMSWAEVQKRFAVVQAFSATVYVSENPLEAPWKMELWINPGSKLRIHSKGKVYFGADGKIIKAFHVKSGEPFVPHRRSRQDAMAMKAARQMGRMKGFSLDLMLQAFHGKQTFAPPLKNSEASIAEDMTVFDITNSRTPEWMRVWVLKSSRLPVRMRMWDPRQAQTTDMLFDYMEPQPDSAFDPEHFNKSIMKQTASRSSKLYTGLKDPGGRAISPEDLFEENGYHMPELKEIGRSKDGVIWVLSGNSVNQTPRGRSIYGFGQLTDDLGQEYIRRYLDEGNTTMEMFIPIEYRLGVKEPSEFTLTCTTQPRHYSRHYVDVDIGSLDVENWEQDQDIPDRFNKTSQDPLRIIIMEHKDRHNWDRFDQLLATIPGEPENDEDAFFREQERLSKLKMMNKYDEALKLSTHLYAIIKDEKKFNWRHIEVIETHIQMLCKAERSNEARPLIVKVKQQLADRRDLYRSFVSSTANFLNYNCGWNVKRINGIFGFNLQDDKEISKYCNFLRHPFVENDPRFEEWRAYVARQAEEYKNKPLPEDMAIVPIGSGYDQKKPAYEVPLPGHEEYIMSRFKNWNEVVNIFAWAESKGQIYQYPKVCVVDELKDDKFNDALISKKDLSHKERTELYMRRKGVEVVKVKQTVTAWVAHYDGRPLPYWRDVKALDASHLGKPDVRAGGTHTSTRSLLQSYQRVVNGGRQTEITDTTVLIVDETGLPDKPGENQTWGSICLIYMYNFWYGDEGVRLAREWFDDTFGITFTEEEREITVYEIRKIKEK